MDVPYFSRRVKTLLFAFIPALCLIVLAEAALWLAGYEGDHFRSILFGDDPRSVLLFQESPSLWWKLRPRKNVNFLDTIVSVDNLGMRSSSSVEGGHSGRQVLCLGDSSTFGWKTPYEATYPSLLEEHLKAFDPDIRVMNGGVPGYTSFQSLRWFHELANRIAPEVVIIYASNNEASLAEYSDRQRSEQAGRMLWVRRLLARSRIYQFARNTFRPPRPFKKTGSLSLEELLGLSPRVNPASYKANLEDLITACQQSRAVPILVTVPNDVRHPYFFEIPSANSRVNALLESAQLKIEDKAYQAALSELDAAAGLDPGYYKTYFLRGKALSNAKKGNSMEAFETALECHPFPERLKGSYNEALKEVALAKGIAVVDLVTVFKYHPAGPDALFIDACHPSPQGHRVIAEALLVQVLSALGKNESFNLPNTIDRNDP